MLSKKLFFVLMFSFFFSLHNFAFASLVIDEIMYNPKGTDTGREWIEVYNDSSASIDLSKWYFFTDNTKHSLNPQGLSDIPAGGYAILVQDSTKFKIDWPNFSGLLFDSSWNDLNNTTGETIALKDPNLNLVSETNYDVSKGGQDDNNSLQKISGSWVGATPTPGVANQTSTVVSTPETSAGNGGLVSSDSNNDTVSSTTPAAKNKIEEPKIKTQIIAKTLGFAGLPLSFQAAAYGYSGERLYFGKYFWNFGDGDSKETNLIDSQSFTHTYFYPGEYVISLDYYSNYYQDFPDASSQMTVKIILADIVISRVGEEKDFFVELANKTDYPANLSNWFLTSDQKSFIIPRNTILASQKTMIISPRITNFSIEDKETLKLMTPEREVAFDYSASLIPIVETEAKTFSSTPTTTPPSAPLLNQGGDGGGNSAIPTENLPALALAGDIIKDDNAGNSHTIIIFIISLIFIGVSAGAVYFIRQKRIIPQSGNDFEILDE